MRYKLWNFEPLSLPSPMCMPLPLPSPLSVFAHDFALIHIGTMETLGTVRTMEDGKIFLRTLIKVEKYV